jgi:hypothetical protein
MLLVNANLQVTKLSIFSELEDCEKLEFLKFKQTLLGIHKKQGILFVYSQNKFELKNICPLKSCLEIVCSELHNYLILLD